MVQSNPIIDTGRGKMTISEAVAFVRSENARTPTPTEPWDTSVILGILRALPQWNRKMAAFYVVTNYNERPQLFESVTAKSLLREARIASYSSGSSAPADFIHFGELSRVEMGLQCQYGSRYLHGTIDAYPNLAEGIRIKGDPFNYHSVYMHIDDVPIFLERYRNHQEAALRGKLKASS